MMLRRATSALVALAALAGAGACTDVKAAERAAATTKVKPIDAGKIPSEILGLKVSPETVKDLSSSHGAYVDQAALYGLRQGDLLEATLQLTRFNDAAKPTQRDFQQRIIAKLGGSVPRPVRMGTQTVYFTTAAKQTLAIWFKGRMLYVLSAREDYAFPRSLVRAALEIPSS
ncbi:MAG: hypothetical protein QOE35_3607 [Actinomycetota bacterium]|jgi:hypothetical protein